MLSTLIGKLGLQCGEDSFADLRGRTTLVAKARWLLLALVGAYGLCTVAFYSLSSHTLFLSPLQILFFSLS